MYFKSQKRWNKCGWPQFEERHLAESLWRQGCREALTPVQQWSYATDIQGTARGVLWLLWLTTFLLLKTRTWGTKWKHGKRTPLLLMGDNFCFFSDTGFSLFVFKFFFFLPSSQRQTMQEAPDSLFLVKDQLLSRIAPSKPSCLGKLQSMLLDRPRLPKLWAPLHPHLWDLSPKENVSNTPRAKNRVTRPTADLPAPSSVCHSITPSEEPALV